MVGKTGPMHSVSDTAYWVAYYRAMESERPDALFRDPYAKRLAGEQGARIVASLKRGRASAWSMVVRTMLFDEILLRRVASEGIDLVLNLAAGLDARPYRLALPASLRWVEADLPGIIRYKEKELAGEKPVCALERVEIDLREREERRRLLAQLNDAAARVFVITEGLLVYLDPQEVAALATDLHLQHFRFWLADIAAPRILKVMNRSWGNRLETAGAPFKFGPAEGSEFFRPCGWREAEFRNFLEESRRLNRRMPMDWMIRVWETVMPRRTARKMKEWRSGALLLEKSEIPA